MDEQNGAIRVLVKTICFSYPPLCTLFSQFEYLWQKIHWFSQVADSQHEKSQNERYSQQSSVTRGMKSDLQMAFHLRSDTLQTHFF